MGALQWPSGYLSASDFRSEDQWFKAGIWGHQVVSFTSQETFYTLAVAAQRDSIRIFPISKTGSLLLDF